MASTAWSVLMLLLVLALIPLVLWSLKRLQTIRPAGGGASPLEVRAQLALGARERVVLLRVEGRMLVLGVTPQQVTLLAEADAGELSHAGTPSANPQSPAFAGLLRNVIAGYTGGKPR